ncbi:MAG TPA: BON domain-containing protein [Bryobacteraceae bacterium]|jgi:hyperosmotically inducible protein|nr:BON domain-containing protein [Bryobacteraceae bacterium]
MYRIASICVLAAAMLAGCSSTTQAPAVAGNVRKALDQADIKNVSVSQDRNKGVVTLTGQVASNADKSRAAQIAQSLSENQVVANEVAIVPPGASGDTKTMYSDLDKGIDNNLSAALIAIGYKNGVDHKVKNGVVTLTGTVDDEAQRDRIQSIAQAVPNTQQVVNEIQTRHLRATTAN